ncbi:hypothetical protein EVJ58_g5221 [Rhodofomes roseus]|uniref:Uncharacterized protein n=1 Tax=Rhodofomes roseus TaxID=34475 RepID=A0A4Y9YCQ1_9APHY|nr:hypothetical protein EVJ58_g5221 [Rhodofomes roseus]
MPAEKTELHTGGYFVAVKDDPTVWKCVPCSENTSSGKISTFLRNKPGRHTKTVKHQNAVKEYLAKPRAPPHAGSNSNNAPGPAATMSLPETFSAHEVLGRSDSNDGSPRYNPLDHIHDDGDHGFVDDAGHEIRLSAGATPEEDSRARIRREVGNLLGNAFVEHGDWGARVAGIAESESVMDEEEARPTIADAVAELHLAGLADDPEDDENTFEMPLPGYEHVHSDPQWHPYTSKTMFILDLLDNLPRLRLSDDHMKVFIWALKECGALNVPTFTHLRAQQARLTKEMNIQTTHHVSAQSNHFYANCPSETTRLDFANPLVRPHMSFLPRVGAPVSEFYDGGKCLELDEKALDCGQLMWMDKENAPRRHFYIRELARLRDGRFVIPVRFVQDKNVDCLDGYLVVHYAATDIFVVRDHALIRVEAKELQDNVVDIERETEIRINDSAPSWVAKNRHPVRAIAAQRPAYTVRLMSWSDDVSGNKSKQYNAHTNVYMANINLPHDKLKQEYFVRFCSTSQHASSSEQLEILAKDTDPDRWHTAYIRKTPF